MLRMQVSVNLGLFDICFLKHSEIMDSAEQKWFKSCIKICRQ